jgi:hypothetical protein
MAAHAKNLSAPSESFDQPLNFFIGAPCPPFVAYLIFVHPDLLADRDQSW